MDFRLQIEFADISTRSCIIAMYGAMLLNQGPGFATWGRIHTDTVELRKFFDTVFHGKNTPKDLDDRQALYVVERICAGYREGCREEK